MIRYTSLRVRCGLWRRIRVYKLIYTLDSLAYLEDSLNISIKDLQTLATNKNNLTHLLFAALKDQHPDIQWKEVCKFLNSKENIYTIYHKLLESCTNSFPKLEPVERNVLKELGEPEQDKVDEDFNHWQYWQEIGLEIGLLPWEMSRMTPKEISLAAKAYNKRNKNKLQLVAWHLCGVLNMWSKKTITVKDMLGENKGTGWESKDLKKLWELRKQYRESKQNEQTARESNC